MQKLRMMLRKSFIRLMKDEIGGKIMEEIAGLRPKTYYYLTDDSSGNKKAKGTKSPIKQRLKFEHYKKCLQKIKRY